MSRYYKDRVTYVSTMQVTCTDDCGCKFYGAPRNSDFENLNSSSNYDVKHHHTHVHHVAPFPYKTKYQEQTCHKCEDPICSNKNKSRHQEVLFRSPKQSRKSCPANNNSCGCNKNY